MSRPLTSFAVAAFAVLVASPLAAQEKPPAKAPAKTEAMDHAAMHGAATWKELDAYHQLMMATWHPAKEKSDMAPIRAKAGEMVASAKLVAASKAPASCASKPEVQKAQAGLPGETEKVSKLVAAKASDADVKAGLKALHDAFEVLEGGCGAKH